MAEITNDSIVSSIVLKFAAVKTPGV